MRATLPYGRIAMCFPTRIECREPSVPANSGSGVETASGPIGGSTQLCGPASGSTSPSAFVPLVGAIPFPCACAEGREAFTMTDDEFLTAMRIRTLPADEGWTPGADPLIEVLRIDDLRSTYCEQLEKRIAQQALEIEALRRLVRLKRSGDAIPRYNLRFRSVVKKIPGWLLPGLMVSLAMFTAQKSPPNRIRGAIHRVP